jgi:predicted RNase H-like HicB family nuclease
MSQEVRVYAVIFEKTSTGWSAYVPDLPGVVATGATRDQVEQLMREGIQIHIEGMIEDGLPVTEPTTYCQEIRVPA